MVGGLTGEVSSIEFCEGDIEVVDVERYLRRDSVVGGCLDETQDFVDSFLAVIHVPRPQKGEMFAAGCYDRCRYVLDTEVDDDPHIPNCGVSTVSWSCTHHASPIVGGNIRGQCVRHSVPISGRKLCQESLGRPTCRVFELRHRPTQFLEPCERGIEVDLVEQFHATDEVAFEHHKAYRLPLGDESVI